MQHGGLNGKEASGGRGGAREQTDGCEKGGNDQQSSR